jgi:hypothetical protein
MKICDLKDFLDKIPNSMNEFQIVFRKFEDDGDSVMYLDYPLTAMYLDEESKESVFLDEENWNYFNEYILEKDDKNEDDYYDEDDENDEDDEAEY